MFEESNTERHREDGTNDILVLWDSQFRDLGLSYKIKENLGLGKE